MAFFLFGLFVAGSHVAQIGLTHHVTKEDLEFLVPLSSTFQVLDGTQGFLHAWQVLSSLSYIPGSMIGFSLPGKLMCSGKAIDLD